MKIVLASKNEGKVKEISKIISPLGIEIVKMDKNIQIDETGETFKQNAYIKANSVYDKTKLPVLADDSGLMVSKLLGDPGVRSARYANVGSKKPTDQQNIEKLLKNMEGIKDRKAKFVCVICLIEKDGQARYFEGECCGEISEKQKGEKGFGYDPVFLYEGRSFANIDMDEKNKISHRGRALTKLIEYLDGK